MVSGIARSVAGSSLLSVQTLATAAGGLASKAAALAGGAPQSAGGPADQQFQNALQAPKALRRQNASTGDAAKGLAMQKLAALKARLKLLMMMGGDPKQRARAAAAIAKEIAAAAQSYAQAGGDPGSSAVSEAGTAAEASPAPDGQAAGGPSVANTAAPDQNADATITAAGAEADPDAPTTSSGANASAAAQTDAGAAESRGRSSTGAAEASASAATPQARGGSSEMDQAFVQEARRLAHQAKAIIRSSLQSLKLQHQTSDPAIVGAGDAALAAVDAAANEIGASRTGGYDGSIPEPAAPSISITA